MILTLDEVLIRLGLSAGRASATDLELVNQVWPEAERAVKEFVGYEIEGPAEYTEFLPDDSLTVNAGSGLDTAYEIESGLAVPVTLGRDEDFLSLAQWPVREIVGLWENPLAWHTKGGDFANKWQKDEGTVFYVDWEAPGISWTGKVYRRTGLWSTRRRTVKVTYSAGLDATELAQGGKYEVFRKCLLKTIQQAFAEAKAYEGGVSGVVVSESLDGWSAEYDRDIIKTIAGMRVIVPDSVKTELWPFVNLARKLR